MLSSFRLTRNFGWIQKFALLVNSHMMLMLLVWGPYIENHFQLVQSLCHVQLFSTPGTAACQASLSITSSRSLLKLMSIKSVMPSNISSSVVPFSACLQSFPASGSVQMSQYFASGGLSIGLSASTSVLPMNTQD